MKALKYLIASIITLIAISAMGTAVIYGHILAGRHIEGLNYLTFSFLSSLIFAMSIIFMIELAIILVKRTKK